MKKVWKRIGDSACCLHGEDLSALEALWGEFVKIDESHEPIDDHKYSDAKMDLEDAMLEVAPELLSSALRLQAMKQEWQLAAVPPDSPRAVLGWMKRGYCVSVHFLNGNWFVEADGRHTLAVTHWRDIEAPVTEA